MGAISLPPDFICHNIGSGGCEVHGTSWIIQKPRTFSSFLMIRTYAVFVEGFSSRILARGRFYKNSRSALLSQNWDPIHFLLIINDHTIWHLTEEIYDLLSNWPKDTLIAYISPIDVVKAQIWIGLFWVHFFVKISIKCSLNMETLL